MKKSGLLSTVGMKSVTPISSGVVYNQPFNASLLILSSGAISYVRPLLNGMAASGSVSLCTPLAKILYSLNVISIFRRKP